MLFRSIISEFGFLIYFAPLHVAFTTLLSVEAAEITCVPRAVIVTVVFSPLSIVTSLLLASGKGIIWVMGHRISADVKVSESTTRILMVEVD